MGMSWRPALAVMACLVGLCGCAPLRRMLHATCIAGACPSVGRAVPDEEYREMRAQLGRIDALRPVLHAAVIEQLPTWFPDVSDMSNEPECASEFVARMEREFFDRTPVTFSRVQFARVRAVGRLHDTTDVMAQKARFLIRVARLADADVGRWEAQPEEAALGEPPRATLQRLAVIALARSNIAMNDQPAREFLRERVRGTVDPWEQLALMSYTSMAFRDGTAGVFRARLDEVRRLMVKPPDRVSVELALGGLRSLAALASEPGDVAAARALCAEILQRRGELPVTDGVAGAARDLSLVAVAARFDLDHARAPVGLEAPSPPARREVFRLEDDPWLGAVAPATSGAGVAAAEGDRADYLEALRSDLAGMRFSRPRCRLLQEMSRWVTPAELPGFVRVVEAPLWPAGRVALTTETRCRVALLGTFRPIDDARTGFLLDLYNLPAERVGAQDLTLDEASGSIAYALATSFRPEVMAALGAHPETVARDPRVRAWIAQVVSRPDTPGHENPEGLLAMHPLVDALLAWGARHGEGTDVAEHAAGRAVLAAGLEIVQNRLREPVSDLYREWHSVRWIYTLAEHSVRYGLDAQVAALLARLREPDLAAGPRPTPAGAASSGGTPRENYRFDWRVAKVAEYILDLERGNL